MRFSDSSNSVALMGLRICQRMNGLLNPPEECAGLQSIHLNVVELEGDGQFDPLPFPAIFASEEHGIVVHTTVKVHHPVQFVLHQSGDAHHHVAGQGVILSRLRRCPGQGPVDFSKGR